MYELLAVIGVGLALLIALRVYLSAWRWRCPRCGARALQYVGTSAIYPTSTDGPFDIRFWQADCGACGATAYCRADGTGSWQLEMQVVPENPPSPTLPIAGGAPEIVFDDVVPSENRAAPNNREGGQAAPSAARDSAT